MTLTLHHRAYMYLTVSVCVVCLIVQRLVCFSFSLQFRETHLWQLFLKNLFSNLISTGGQQQWQPLQEVTIAMINTIKPIPMNYAQQHNCNHNFSTNWTDHQCFPSVTTEYRMSLSPVTLTPGQNGENKLSNGTARWQKVSVLLWWSRYSYTYTAR